MDSFGEVVKLRSKFQWWVIEVLEMVCSGYAPLPR